MSRSLVGCAPVKTGSPQLSLPLTGGWQDWDAPAMGSLWLTALRKLVRLPPQGGAKSAVKTLNDQSLPGQGSVPSEGQKAGPLASCRRIGE